MPPEAPMLGSLRARWHRSGARAVLRAGVLRLLALRPPTADGVSHLLMHGVPPERARAFEDLLSVLEEHGPVVPLREALERRARGDRAPAFTLSFDDGCLTTATVARPILARRGLSATLFAASGYLGLEGTALRQYMREGLRWPEIIEPMTRDHLRAWAASGFEVGSHGVSHRPFSELDEEEATRELVESRRALEEITGRPVEFFAWPFGRLEDFPSRYVDLAHAAGYRVLFSGVSRRDTAALPPGVMPRRQVDPAWDLPINLYFALRG